MTDPFGQLSTALAGRYRLEREVGRGGMATVYLAEDLKHHRNVAIKVLREDLTITVGAARFLREIEIAAQLQHPNILPLLDSGEAPSAREGGGSLLYYVMPYVDGLSLRQRLSREHELPVGEAVRILIEVVDAIAYAHAHGVVHRDIKPDNVMLSGRHALVTDFGVARAVREAAGSSSITTGGIALGTPAYIAPEQAAADPNVDHRADIYAVGIVAYELLAGRPPFTGTSPHQVLAAHVTETPDPLSKYRPGIPAELEQVVMRCLAKRPADRWQSAAELMGALEPLSTPSGGLAPTAARSKASATRRWVMIGVPVAVIAAGAAIVFTVTRDRGGSRPSIEIGRSSQLTSDPGLEVYPAFSPDGKFVAYAAGNSQRMRIVIHPVGGGRTIPLSDDTTAVETNPRWSPDGRQLLFLTHGGVSIAPAMGGSARAVIAGRAGANVQSAAWAPDGRQIAFSRADSLFVNALDGSAPRHLASFSDPHSCSWAPTGRWIACVSGNSESLTPGSSFGNRAPSAIVVVPADGGSAVELTDRRTLNQSPAWSEDGQHIYFVSNRDGPRDVYDQALNASARPRGAPARLTTASGIQSISLAKGHTHLAYSVYQARANIWSLPVPASGPVSSNAAVAVTSGSQIIESLSLSKDGRWLLYSSDIHGASNIYRIATSGGTPEPLTSETFDVFVPQASPDGLAVAYHSMRTGTRDIEVKRLDGAPVEFVTASPSQERDPTWSPDAQALAFYDQEPQSLGVYVTRRAPDGRWGNPLLRYAGGIRPQWSPDGSQLAVVSPQGAIRMMSPDSGDARVLFQPSGSDPRAELVRWSPDARLLFFKSHDAEGRASYWSISAAGGRPRHLVQFTDPAKPSNRYWFATDGTRFFFTIEDRQSDIWVSELTRK